MYALSLLQLIYIQTYFHTQKRRAALLALARGALSVLNEARTE